MKKMYDLEELFKDILICTREALSSLENLFGVTSLYNQVLGEDAEMEAEQLRASPAWATLHRLHDYALFGRLNGWEPLDIVLDGSTVIKLVSSESHWPGEGWQRLVAMADARNGLDQGDDVEQSRVALLANVDLRTVRNACSAGDLPSTKEHGLVFIENAAARRWLAARRGFIPTEVLQHDTVLSVAQVQTPADFGALLKRQRDNATGNDGVARPPVRHPSVDADTLVQLENGVFALPLDAVFPLADFYGLPQHAFLECVMRVFFRTELDAIVAHVAVRAAS
jgi:hypothetical protein